MQSCLSCDFTQGKLSPPGGFVYESKLIAISHAVPPCQHRGFMIVAPKRHCEHIAALTSDEMKEIFSGIHMISQILTKLIHPEKIYVCSFGETVKHVHFYVIPRDKEMPARGVTVLHEILYENKWQCTTEEAANMAAQIRREIEHVHLPTNI